MYNAETLQDIHQRAHESLRRLIAFCSVLTEEERVRPLAGFGFPTILRQLEHTIGAEVYWQTVQGQVLAMCRTMGKPNEVRDLDYPVD
jgi:hypothetical protein